MATLAFNELTISKIFDIAIWQGPRCTYEYVLKV